MSLDEAIRDWFARFGASCAAVDYDAAREQVAPDVVSFGTRMEIVAGRESLIDNQWRGIWPNIRDFRFELRSLRSGGDEQTAWGACLWRSTGFDEDGSPFERPGRATVIFERRDGRWLAVHTHFSLYPGTPQTTHGERRRP